MLTASTKKRKQARVRLFSFLGFRPAVIAAFPEVFPIGLEFFFLCHVASNSLPEFTQKHTQILIFRQLPLSKGRDSNG